jgi:hypothetical protein
MKNIVMIPKISQPTKDAYLVPYSAIQKVLKSNNTLYIGPFNDDGLTIYYDTEELARKDFDRLIHAMNGDNTNAESPLTESERPGEKKTSKTSNMSGPAPDAWAVAQLR